MTSKESFFDMCHSFPGVEQNPHFERTAFKVTGKRIFATYHSPSNSANIVLSPTEQHTFCEYEGGAIYPVPNKWGEKGWTTFELKSIPPELVLEALNLAYELAKKSKTSK